MSDINNNGPINSGSVPADFDPFATDAELADDGINVVSFSAMWRNPE